MKKISLANNKVTLLNGLEAAYYDSGDMDGIMPKGTAVILLHGYCGSSAYWEKILPALHNLGRIVIPDLRGHGLSSAPDEESYAMETFAEDLGLLAGELRIDKICLFGHSLGGYAALAYAEKNDGRLKTLGLVHSTALPDGAEAKQNRDKAVQAIQAEGIEPFVDGLVPKLFAPHNREEMKAAIERVMEIGYGTNAAGAAATARGMKNRADRSSVLEGLGLPRLLIAGSEDGVIPAEKTFTAEGADVSQVLLDGCGHMSMLESPGELASRIVAFVRHQFVK
ncbi:alpha/beta fold hydrolase [Paenibacillus mendelii]|uniref:Alpha/beta fold hydrolase n=1 Tax=Paenibacillus mendelii TaxID=206163 RepID=A0ABV6JJ07_9BACL|nr:alpha/beta hydrolase [Paenibacillus mendelii]MCQ6558827.1 alpha/beta hydrolase [Paenibacillus mendelii]